MDPFHAMTQQFTTRFGRAPSDLELADMFIAAGISLHAQTLPPAQVATRIQQMLTPGTPLNTFLRLFK